MASTFCTSTGRYFWLCAPRHPIRLRSFAGLERSETIGGDQLRRRVLAWLEVIGENALIPVISTRRHADGAGNGRVQLQLRGEAVRTADSLALDVPNNFADFSVSKNGVLALNSVVYQHELIWLDRAGNRLGSATQ